MVRRFTPFRLPACIAVVAMGLAIGGIAPSPAFGQAAAAQSGRGIDLEMLRTRLEQRYEVLPLHNGIALAPRSKGAVRSIEVSDGTVALDGTEVTGSELRQRLGSDADLILQLSYLDPPSRRAFLGLGAPPQAPPAEAPAPRREPPSGRRARHRDTLVRIGSNVTVPADETITEDVVVIGGNAEIDGQVDGEVVVVGGSARLGPQAEVRRDVTVVGGTLSRDPAAVVHGRVNEVGLGAALFNARPFQGGAPFSQWWLLDRITPFTRLAGTLLRVALLIMFAFFVVLVARTPVERIAERAAAEPIKAGLVGLLAELAFVPVLIITVVVLAISIVGIPLLVLVPLAVVALLLVLLVGFTGVAYRVGRRTEAGLGRSRGQAYMATLLGIGIILSPLILGRIAALATGPGVLVAMLVGIGVVIEYIGWTVGLGAAALVRFGAPLPAPVEAGARTDQATITTGEPHA